MKTDTIAAISTPLSSSGIGIVRLSGDEAISVADKIFRKAGGGSLSDAQTHTIHYGRVWDKDGMVDEVLVMLMRSPRSFTTEDTVEINCHGGVYVMKRVLQAALENGAVMAAPGEYTKRAFLNGRIDLSQAEAVMDLIQSQNQYAMEASLAQLGGEVSQKIRELRDQILYEIAYIESALDDPEHISLDGFGDNLYKKIEVLLITCDDLIRSFRNGRIIREGINTVILGKPNAGKSSVMNRILGEERAIVTDIAGTTRDTLEEPVNLGGFSLNMIDTAGIHETEDKVEKIGIERALSSAEKADMILYIIDGLSGASEEDVQLLDRLKEKKTIVLWNKSDQIASEEETVSLQLPINSVYYDELNKLTEKIIPFSAVTGEGLSELIDLIHQMFYDGDIGIKHQFYITNERHVDALREAAESLKLVLESIKDQMPEDFYSIDLMNAYACLGSIIGESVEDDLVNEIFSKFCMGK
ncbi:MAG: tRNA uridine-5-carboxymethylaminomethyl(34) synthesis GTPase MnmE [Lachnospiraceae bacterium]|nr:tRNA uridine-5-carboxymethylaminomethyl(34) synthesis GTPase MnmE [Lachnospiraceae bacterium]